jgi:hypothetical protein
MAGESVSGASRRRCLPAGVRRLGPGRDQCHRERRRVGGRYLLPAVQVRQVLVTVDAIADPPDGEHGQAEVEVSRLRRARAFHVESRSVVETGPDLLDQLPHRGVDDDLTRRDGTEHHLRVVGRCLACRQALSPAGVQQMMSLLDQLVRGFPDARTGLVPLLAELAAVQRVDSRGDHDVTQFEVRVQRSGDTDENGGARGELRDGPLHDRGGGPVPHPDQRQPHPHLGAGDRADLEDRPLWMFGSLDSGQ